MKAIVLGALGLTLTLAPPGDEETPTLLRATLRSQDFLWHTVSLDNADSGKVLNGRQIFNRDSDLDFGVRNPDAFTVGVQGGQIANIIDCGHWKELAFEYGYEETVGGGHGFNSIRFENGILVILEDRENQTYQPFTKGNTFLEMTPNGSDTSRVHPGHVYLVHILDRHDPTVEHIAKLFVLSHVKDQEVTLTWENLDRKFPLAR